jgi:hypothetical protein
MPDVEPSMRPTSAGGETSLGIADRAEQVRTNKGQN